MTAFAATFNKEASPMNATPDNVPHPRRRLRFALAAILGSATIATLMATGLAHPHPELKLAYLLCVAVGATGLVQLGIAIFSRSADGSPEQARDG
jgi:hypothetical protein